MSYDLCPPLISRRDFLGKAATVAGGLGLAGLASQAGAAEQQRPNVVIFLFFVFSFSVKDSEAGEMNCGVRCPEEVIRA